MTLPVQKTPFTRLQLAFKALQQLGPSQSALYALYQLGLRTGHYRRLTPSFSAARGSAGTIHPALSTACWPQEHGPFTPPIAEADEILSGKVRLFGGAPVPLALTQPAPLPHWTACEKTPPGEDIKFTWEPARFGWAFILGRAYHFTHDERYPAAFWQFAETFLEANPPNLGPHWSSAQEVALRLLAFTFAAQVFGPSAHSSPARLARLGGAIAAHAERIPPTLVYARAQNNNHLISEAVGLYTAAAALPEHPSAPRWRRLGWKWLNHALQTQISPDGAYAQQSANYHRLVLQAALWAASVQAASFSDQPFPEPTRQRLAAATRWLLSLADQQSGGLPNLGPNDGAYIFPLSSLPFADYRPILQAAAQVFLGQRPFPSGPWDEMAHWLSAAPQADHPANHTPSKTGTPCVIHAARSWAYLRSAHFTSRPGHADQLHVDLWWRGINIAQDPGTYRYNAPAPWDNTLAQACVHNTITIDNLDQMTRAGRFLYLDWAQAEHSAQESAPDGTWQRAAARHNGYRRLGLIHQRTLTAQAGDCWQILDQVLPASSAGGQEQRRHTIRLHWLLPDWQWDIEDQPQHTLLRILSPHGWVNVTVEIPNRPDLKSGAHPTLSTSLMHAGSLLHGPGPASPIQGWTSPTYGDKIPALAFIIDLVAPAPISILTSFSFPTEP